MEMGRIRRNLGLRYGAGEQTHTCEGFGGAQEQAGGCTGSIGRVRDRSFLCEDGKEESDQRAESRNAMTYTIYEYTIICRLTGSRHTGVKGPGTARADGGRGVLRHGKR
eukprot:9846660-Heterocapsa_arctica.AAC.1